ncbi:MAG: soluble lytic murein transglycosylase [Gaiellales bacterium]|jgi:soluble lytic murein transglycosylase|nr:soluble lytic murein transglycosylase [Gaiellales bacterium]
MRRLLWLAGGLVAVGVVLYVLFGHKGREFIERAEYPLRYPAIVRAHARNYGIDPALLAAVIYTESRFRPHVRSPSGAIGLMQLLPSTAEGIATRTGGSRFVASDLDDPEINVRYGAWYLRHLRQHYASLPDAMTLALAAYNAGMANVDTWAAHTRPGQALQIPAPFAETRTYLARVEHARSVYRRLYPGELGLSRAVK